MSKNFDLILEESMKKARVFVTILLVLVVATASVFAQGGGEKKVTRYIP